MKERPRKRREGRVRTALTSLDPRTLRSTAEVPGPEATGELVALLAEVSGRRAPRVRVPTSLLRAMAPAGGLLGPALGLPPNLAELIRSSDGVTFWASGAKARTQLGWTSRPLREGLQQLVDAR